MTIMVMGKPDSGKSEKAEKMICEMSSDAPRYYIATMIPFGDEGRQRIEKHRKLREGKGFVTIEQPFDVAKVLEEMGKPEEAAVLLECISNLAANEMFERKCKDIAAIVEKITEDVKCIKAKVKDLVIVTNSFEVDPAFDEETKAYVNLMEEVNRSLKSVCDEVITVTDKDRHEYF